MPEVRICLEAELVKEDTVVLDGRTVREVLWANHCEYNNLLKLATNTLFAISAGTYPISKTNNPDTIDLAQRIIAAGLECSNPKHTIDYLRVPKNEVKKTLADQFSSSPQYIKIYESLSDDLIPLQIPELEQHLSDQQTLVWYEAFGQLRTHKQAKQYSATQRGERKTELNEFLQQHASTIPLIDSLSEQLQGTSTGQNRTRWAKYAKALTTIIPDQNLEGIKFNGQRRDFTKLIKQNPQLQELDDLYRQYNRKKRIGKPYTHTQPHCILHPKWVNYKNNSPNLRKPIKTNNGLCTTSLAIIEGRRKSWIPIHFRGDARLHTIITKDNKQYIKIDKIEYNIKALTIQFENTQQWRTCPIKIKIGLGTKSEKPPKYKNCTPEPNSRFVSIDQGTYRPHHCAIGFYDSTGATILETFEPDIQLDNIRRRINNIERRIIIANKKTSATKKRLHQNNARLSRRNCRSYYKERNDLLDEYCRKLSRHLLKKLAENPAKHHYIILEDLATLTSSKENNRWHNRKLANMAHGRLRETIETMAKRGITDKNGNHYIITVIKKGAAGTSQTCHKCGQMGIRYGLTDGKIDLNRPQGPLFICPHCLEPTNSDKNAAINLIKYAVRQDWLTHWPKDKKQRYEIRAELKKQLLPVLEKLRESDL